MRKLIRQQIEKEEDETDEVQNFEKLSFKQDYLKIQTEELITGIKSFNIYSGTDVLRGLKGGVTHLNKILKVLSSERQEINVWISGVYGKIQVFHRYYREFFQSGIFGNTSTFCVVINTAVLAMNGLFSDQKSNDILDQLNQIFTYIFIAEMAAKLLAFGPLGYLRDRMNIFDGSIVLLSIFELIFFSGGNSAVSAFRSVRIFRTFRVLRVTRLLRGLEFMGKIISVIMITLDSFIYIALLLFLFIYIYTLLGMQIYGGQLNQKNIDIRQNFDDFQSAFITVFQLVTLENWNDILYKTFNSDINKGVTTIYLVSWIFIGNWTFLNLFLAILLDGFTASSMNEQEDIYDDEGNQYEYDVSYDDSDQKQIQQNEEEGNFQRIDTDEMEQIEMQMLLEDQKEGLKVQLFKGIQCQDSLFIFSQQNKFRIICYKIVQHNHFEHMILAFIVTSSIKLVVDSYIGDDNQALIISDYIDYVFNIIFTLEAMLKIIAYGFIFDENSYLTESWSQIDFFIVCSALIDMCFDNVNIPVIKILRMLRTLRPLRFISHNVNMKVVVIALFESISGILNVLVVIILIWIMFAILSISLIGNRMGYCNGLQNYYGINQTTCNQICQEKQELKCSWSIFDTNFDNILTSMTTLYIVSSLENWPNIMFQAVDSNMPEYGPDKDNYQIIQYFFVVFILIGSFFLVNLFVGVIFFNFNNAQKNEKRQSSIFLTEEQSRWIELQQMIIVVKAEFAANKEPTNQVAKKIYQIVISQYFDSAIMICIILNIISMALSYEGSSIEYNNTLEKINYFFTTVFIVELIMKLIAFRFEGFWISSWNKFDLFVVISSIIDIVLNFLGNGISFLRVGPQLIRIVRVLRVTRLLKLVKSMQGLQKIIDCMVFAFPSLMNVGALLLLVFFIYSVLGVFLFKDVKQGNIINSYNNFFNFGNAMITLFRCSTGENWQVFMFDCGKTEGSFSKIYFISFILICTFIMLNLFILIIIQYFEDYHMKEDNPLQFFNDKVEIFRVTWSKFTAFSLGEKIEVKNIVNFLQELPHPLGKKI
ncbi:hypothetical protein IMG5_072530 [Ichthyophthirius multifiliis]|uniref:Ion transport domain-containing protein n=1 Tax=Ichthyophthirius multifiliis TaxID=5932 RepID=G0QPX7_ICHMU|nr:hypothetical protein IMG5_072530 [Ichthyophthirius multifiliis]EGR32725.1 hypothetical protein IMG5_072530 [Ichthyophthirius multifiliis]|eukprot:XP_004036711.1 hypothetical protein IMG5_072530 [Ichthyophthirius multifiliis]